MNSPLTSLGYRDRGSREQQTLSGVGPARMVCVRPEKSLAFKAEKRALAVCSLKVRNLTTDFGYTQRNRTP